MIAFDRKTRIVSVMRTINQSTAELVRSYIEAAPQGEPFSSVELLSLGTRAAVDSALSRLAGQGFITRITRGVYVRPLQSKYAGQVTPDPFKIAQAVARSTGSVVGINGAEAARGFALSTQMSMQSLFLTTGPNRVIYVGKSKIRMRHTSPRKLALAGTPAGRALTALYYLGKNEVTPEVVGEIKKRLPEREFEKLSASTEVMPSWMSDVLYRYTNESLKSA
jgi:hypothetical protein